VDELLRGAAISFENVLGGGGAVYEQWLRYHRAATESQRLLAAAISPPDVTRLILTPRYWALLNYRPSSGADPTLAGLLSLELTERQLAMRSALEDFHRVQTSFLVPDGTGGRRSAVLVVADTNVYLHRPEPLPEIPWAQFVGTEADDILLLIPLVVVEELDRAKRRRGPVRARAGHSVKWLNSLFAAGTDIARVAPVDADAQGSRIYARLLLDDREHRRLPDPDAEIIDEATTVHIATGQEVHLVTADTGMAFRAQTSPLLIHPVEAEALRE